MKGTTKWILKGVRPHLWMLFLLVLINAAVSGVQIYFAVAVKNVIDSAIANDGNFLFAVAAIILTVIVQLLLNVLGGYVDTKLRAKLEISYKTSMFKSILKKDYSFLSYHSGDIMTRLTNDAGTVSDAMTHLLPSVVSMVTRLVGIFALMFTYDTAFTFCLMGGGVVVVVLSRLLKNAMKKMHRRVNETDGKWRSYVHEILSHLPVVWVFGADGEVTNRSENLQDDNLKAKLKRSFLHIGMGTFYGLLFQGAYVYTLIWGAFNLGPAFTYGTLSAMLNLITQVSMPLTNISNLFSQVANMTASAERMIEIENFPEREEATENYRELLTSSNFRLSIEDIRFAYERDEVFKGASTTINKGDFVVISGASGIGKSTLFKLMLGLAKPSSGEISLSLENENIPVATALRGAVGYVPQGNLIFSGTVRENIAFAKPDATDEEIVRAARLSCADEFIEQLPEKTETVIGERGFGLSEGQIQRLSIARAILYDAPVILLDEATSALDEVTEYKVLENLKNLGKTVVLISHKKAALEICTRNITVTDGRFEEKEAGVYHDPT